MLRFCPQVPHCILFPLMLLPSLLSTGNFLYMYPDWENYRGLGVDSRTFHHHEDQNKRHIRHQRNSNQEPCLATPDIYFVLDKSDRMARGWPYVSQFVEDMLQRLSNQDLRVSFISFSCKGNIILPITGNREEIKKGLQRLKNTIPAGHEELFQGLWKANKQIKKVNSGGVHRPSMIISVLFSPLDDITYNYSLEEVDIIRKMGTTIYSVGLGLSEEDQIKGLAGKPENAFPNKKVEDMTDLITPLASKICPSLTSLDTRFICMRESTPVVLRGKGFDFAMRKEDVICRFHFMDINKTFTDFKAFNLTNTTVTCPGPIVGEPGKMILVELSLDNGKNFMNKNLFVASKTCDVFLEVVAYNLSFSQGATFPPTVKPTTRRHTTPSTTISTTTTTPSIKTTPTIATLPTTKSPTTEVLKPSIDGYIFAPIILFLVLTTLLAGCFWQLCCHRPVEEELPKPEPQPREKKQPPPPASLPTPTPPEDPSPIVIVCCCECCCVYVSSDTEPRVHLGPAPSLLLSVPPSPRQLLQVADGSLGSQSPAVTPIYAVDLRGAA
ncbi:anthrax toxin receptor-like [Meriones unguiculatus]|uniref:anthrax toxin receptor-like n=1 Tax=Meriones unguiculatus TaxID=10047 RepID=UPI00293F2AF7|nr:anthrax toxin receptor-like [Meriones unguiculatus]